MRIFEKYARADFTSYEDFHDNFKINVPERFNFAYDVLDELAAAKPDKRALVWVHENGTKKVFTFADMKRLSEEIKRQSRELLNVAGHNQGRQGNDHIKTQLPVLVHYNGSAQDRCHYRARDAPFDKEGYRIPR